MKFFKGNGAIGGGKLAYLEKRAALLDWLRARGVDNWEGYCTPPDREEYETDEEYEKAYWG